MAESAFCNACNAWVTVSAEGGCPNGHPRPQLRGLRQGPPPGTTANPAARPTTTAAAMPQPAASVPSPAPYYPPTPSAPVASSIPPAPSAQFPPPAPAHELRAGDAGGDPIPIGVEMNATIDPRALMTPNYVPDMRPDMTDLISGQKCVIWAILLNLTTLVATIAITGMIGPLGGSGLGIMWLIVRYGLSGVTWLMSMWGVFLMVRSMGASFLFYPAMLFPVISLLALLILNARATGRLRSNGYKVGLLGVSAE